MIQLSLQVESLLGHEVTDIVRRCLSLSPSNRPTMEWIVDEVAPLLLPQLL